MILNSLIIDFFCTIMKYKSSTINLSIVITYIGPFLTGIKNILVVSFLNHDFQSFEYTSELDFLTKNILP